MTENTKNKKNGAHGQETNSRDDTDVGMIRQEISNKVTDILKSTSEKTNNMHGKMEWFWQMMETIKKSPVGDTW